MIPVIFHLGPLPINSFGLLMVCCFVVAHRRLYLSLQRGGERAELAEPMIYWAAIGGIVGARIDYLLSFPTEFWEHPIRTVFSGAGFVFYGGFVGGVLGVWILLRRNQVRFFRYADLSAAALALGYAVGRIGCLLSGDGDYGKASDLPWAMNFSLGVVPTPPGVLVHPTPAYETIVALFIAYILVRFEERRTFKGTGQLFAVYLFLSACARFWVESLRVEPVIAYSLTQAQIMAIAVVVAAAVLFLFGARNREQLTT